MKCGAFIGLLMVFAFVIEAQSAIENDSTFLVSHRLFFAKKGLDISGYNYSNPNLNLSLHQVCIMHGKRDRRFRQAALDGGISAIFFILYAIHHNDQPNPEKPLSLIFLDPFFLATMGSVSGAFSVGYLISGCEANRKMNKAIDNSRKFLMRE